MFPKLKMCMPSFFSLPETWTESASRNLETLLYLPNALSFVQSCTHRASVSRSHCYTVTYLVTLIHRIPGQANKIERLKFSCEKTYLSQTPSVFHNAELKSGTVKKQRKVFTHPPPKWGGAGGPGAQRKEHQPSRQIRVPSIQGVPSSKEGGEG